MSDALKQRIKQEADFESPAEAAMLNLVVAADFMRERSDRIFAGHGLTHGQYNVLRILRGVHPEGHARCDIASRMLEKAPDVTRLVDRLEAQALVERDRSEADRRLSITRITNKGLELLKRMQPDVDDLSSYFAERVSRRDARELSRICEGIYAEEDDG